MVRNPLVPYSILGHLDGGTSVFAYALYYVFCPAKTKRGVRLFLSYRFLEKRSSSCGSFPIFRK